MKLLWAVTSGSYSDYSVDAVCGSEAIAKRVVEMLDGGDDVYDRHSVEQLPFYADIPEMVGWYRLTVRINRETAMPETAFEPTYSLDLPHNVGRYLFGTPASARPQIKVRNAPAGFWIDGQCLDKQTLLKAMSDRVVQLTPEQTKAYRRPKGG